LNFTDQAGIIGTYNAANGVLALTGSASVSDYESAIRSVSYNNLSNNPSTLIRTVSIETFDGADSSNVLTRDILIDPINDSPVVSGSDSERLFYTENEPAIDLLTNFSINDVDNTTLQSAQITFTENFSATEDQLRFNSISNIIGDFDQSTGILTLSGNASIADYEVAIRSITYSNTSDDPETSPRQLDISVSDGFSSSNSLTLFIESQPVNDAPVAMDSTITLSEDSQYIFTTDDFGFTDSLDGHSFSGIVIQLPTAGSLTLNSSTSGSQAVAQGQFISVEEISAGNLLFTPEPDANGEGSAQLDFHVVDDGGTALNGIDTSVEPAQIAFDINSVNDAPLGSNKVIVTPEDTPYVFSRDDFGFSDPSDNDSFTAITIGTLPPQGTLTLDSALLQTDSVVNIELIDNGLLHYTPSPDANGLGYQGFSFRVHDNGDPGNQGLTIDQTENFISFDLPAVNDPPLLTTTEAAFDEGSENTLNADQINAIDPDTLPEGLTLTVNSLPNHGVLTIDGNIATTGSLFTLEQLLQDRVIYTHDGSETSSDFFDIEVTDGADSNAVVSSGRFSFVINEVIDPAPEIEDESVTLNIAGFYDSVQGSTLDSGKSTLAAQAIDGNPALTVSIESQPTNGSLEITPDGAFIYTHDGNSVDQDSFSYRVTNEDGISAVARVMINIEPVFQAAFEAPLPGENTASIFIPDEIDNLSQVTESTVEQHETLVDAELPEENAQVNATDDTEQEESSEQAEASNESNPNQLDTNLTDILASPSTDLDTSTEQTDASAVRTIQNFDLDVELLNLTGTSSDRYGIKQHNIFNYDQLGYEGNEFARATLFDISIEVNTTRAHEVVTTPEFLKALSDFNENFEELEKSSQIRHKLTEDFTLGVSLSATAGVLAWLLRGGVMLASVMAYTPIWSSVDPVRVVKKGENEDLSNETNDDVEKYFS